MPADLALHYLIFFTLRNEGLSISNQPDLFLTDWHCQYFHSVFGHHNKTCIQKLGIIGSLVDYFNAFSDMTSDFNNV